MLTKKQKQEQVKEGIEEIKKSRSLFFADFTGIPTFELRRLRIILRETGDKFRVIKKRLLKIALKDSGAGYDPNQFESQVGTFFISSDAFSLANKIYKFVKDLAKSKKDFKILGGLDLANKKSITAEEFVTMAKLPSREQLLTQIAVMLTLPVKKLMIALNSRGEQIAKQKRSKTI